MKEIKNNPGPSRYDKPAGDTPESSRYNRQAQNSTPPNPKQEELDQLNRELGEVLGVSGEKASSSEPVSSQMAQLKKERRRSLFFVPAIVLCVLLLLAGGAAAAVYGLYSTGRKSLLAHNQEEGVEISAPEDAKVEENGKIVTWKGKKYERNENIVAILGLGIDKKTEGMENMIPGEAGQSDTIIVGALDVETGDLNLINISRDTMADIDLYNENGEYSATERMQICLAYAYGDGREKSCENARKAISRLLYGIPIDAYFSITVPAIGALNDSIGGVEVEVLEDLSDADPALTKGARVLLTGDQVRTYVISRDWFDVEANNGRMMRQRQYMAAFMDKAIGLMRQNLSTVLTIYEAVRANMVTDLNLSRMVYLARLAMTKDFSDQNIITVPGTIEKGTAAFGEEHAEFTADEEALYQIILDVFYNEV